MTPQLKSGIELLCMHMKDFARAELINLPEPDAMRWKGACVSIIELADHVERLAQSEWDAQISPSGPETS